VSERDPETMLPYGFGEPPSEGSDLVRFIAVILAGAIMLGALFLLIRARQENNSESTYEACLSRVEAQENPPGFRPENFCQRPK
jgi:hypothetical protein